MIKDPNESFLFPSMYLSSNNEIIHLCRELINLMIRFKLKFRLAYFAVLWAVTSTDEYNRGFPSRSKSNLSSTFI